MEKPKPFLRWAGSKRKQISHLRCFWRSDHARYVEPFAGSACLFFDLQPSKAILSDKNAELIEAYAVVCSHSEEVYQRVVELPRTKDVYYAERSRNPKGMSPLERTVRFIYLNRNCFNGIYRTNVQGHFNVPFASSRAGSFVSREEFLAAASLLSRAKLQACDFGTTLRYVREGDFVYLDPPYVVESRRVFREYGSNLFDANDLGRLACHLRRLDERGAEFVVSYADCREARLLAKEWRSRRIRVRRHVAGFTGARRSAYELLIWNADQEPAWPSERV